MSLSFGFPVAIGPSHGGLGYGFPRWITLALQRRMWIRRGGEWRQIAKAYVKVAGAWQMVAVRQKIGGNWIPII